MPLPVLHTPKLPPPYDELVDFPEADPESMLGIFHDNLYSKENIEKALTQTLFKGSKELHDEKVKGLSESELGEFMQMYVRAKVPRADRKYHVIIYGVSGYTGGSSSSTSSATSRTRASRSRARAARRPRSRPCSRRCSRATRCSGRST